jgi:hypothetical protein
MDHLDPRGNVLGPLPLRTLLEHLTPVPCSKPMAVVEHLLGADRERDGPVAAAHPGTGMRTVLATGTVKLLGDQPVLAPTAPAGADPWLALQLLGEDLPPVETRVAVEGVLSARSLYVSHWRPEPESTSAWAPIAEDGGVTPKTAQAILAGLPEDWPIISFGEAKVPGDRRVVQLEVQEATPEISAWVQRQPPGSIRLVTFISPTA